MTTASRRRAAPRVFAALLVASLVLAHLCFALVPRAFEPWNLQATDFFLFRLRRDTGLGQPRYDPLVVLVEERDGTALDLGVEIVTQKEYAGLIRALRGFGVALQIHDSFFRAADEHTRLLIAAVEEQDDVQFGAVAHLDRDPPPGARGVPETWGIRVEGDETSIPESRGSVTSFPDLARVVRGHGFLDVALDRDGTIRRTPLLARTGDGFLPSFALLAACTYLEVPPERVVLRPGKSLTLEADPPVVIPIDERGYMRVNYLGKWGMMDRFTFQDVIHAAKTRDALVRKHLEGAVVVVADLSTAASDVAASPFDSDYPKPGIHATALHTILTRQFVRDLTLFEMLPLELVWLAGLYGLALRRSTNVFLAGSVAWAAAFLAMAMMLFFYAGLIVHVVRPLMMLVFGGAAALAYRYLVEERQRAVVQASFERCFPPRVVRRLVDDPGRIAVGSERKELTILFSDIKGFTSRSATMDPADVQAMLNDYFDVMVDTVFEHSGTLDKFIGDGLMVFFGDPEPQPDHAERAVKTAIDMQDRLRTLNQKWKREGRSPLTIRIGINTGEVAVGNMGSPRRISYTVIGSAVNLAARLESAAPPGGILISESTRAALSDAIATRAVDPVQLKGFDDPVPAFVIVQDGKDPD